MLDDLAVRTLLLRTAARDDGSAAAFESLYRMCAPLLLGVARRIVNRREVAEEILHDSFVKIWNLADRFDPLALKPVAWMVTIVRNRAIDVQSSHDVAKVDAFDDDGGDVESLLDQAFDWSNEPAAREDNRRAVQWLRSCLGELQASERQALVLAYDRGLSHHELAAHLDKPLGTVKAWVRRGMTHLRGCLETRLGSAP